MGGCWTFGGPPGGGFLRPSSPPPPALSWRGSWRFGPSWGGNEEVTCAEARKRVFPLKDVRPRVPRRRGVPRHPRPLLPRTRTAVPGSEGLGLHRPSLARRAPATPGAPRSLLSPLPAPKGTWGAALASPIYGPSTPGGGQSRGNSGCPDKPMQPLPGCLVNPTDPIGVSISQIWKLRHRERLGARPPGPTAHIPKGPLFTL